VTHTYSAVGRFAATVTVRDNHGGSSTSSVTIDAGNSPPAPSIVSPTSSARFAVAQTITLQGSASDAQEGTLPDAALSWTVVLHHGSHTHPFLGPVSGNAIPFQAPAPEDLDATTTSYLEIRLTATDSQGASTTIVRNLQPLQVAVTLDSIPSGLTISANGKVVTTPATLTSWARYQIRIAAATQRDASSQPWLFSSWSDGGAASHVITTPSTSATFTATFQSATSFTAAADAYVRGGTYAGQNFGTAGTLDVKLSTDSSYERRAFVRFTIGTRTTGRAVLRMYGALSSSGTVPIRVLPVASTSWSETAMTWTNKPASGTSAIATNTVIGTASAWYEFDVTTYVRNELAAGRTAVAFALVSPTSTSPYARLRSREAAANRPELLLADDDAAISSDDVVLYASDAVRIVGTWRLVSDASAAGGSRVWNPNAGAPKVTSASATPASFVELTFTAQAARAYRLWIRGRAEANSYDNDSAFVQFSDSVTSAGAAAYRIGTASATAYVLEDCSGCGVSGWGWQDNGYGTGVLGPLIYFATTGSHTVRVQTREDGLSFDQLVLSPATYLSAAPGGTKNDATIVPKP
jgi:hypothetical protein